MEKNLPPDFPAVDVDTVEVDREQLARAFGVSRPYVSRLARDGVIPPPVDRRYRLKASVHGYLRFLQSRPPGESPALKAEVEKQRARILTARAASAEIDLGLQSGALGKITDYEGRWGAKVEAFRSKLLGIPNKAAPLLAVERDPAACRAIVADLVAEALAELSD